MFFFFNDTATTEIYTLSLHDALPILLVAPTGRTPGKRIVSDPEIRLALASAAFDGLSRVEVTRLDVDRPQPAYSFDTVRWARSQDRKSTRLNSSHANISYAVFCLKKK